MRNLFLFAPFVSDAVDGIHLSPTTTVKLNTLSKHDKQSHSEYCNSQLISLKQKFERSKKATDSGFHQCNHLLTPNECLTSKAGTATGHCGWSFKSDCGPSYGSCVNWQQSLAVDFGATKIAENGCEEWKEKNKNLGGSFLGACNMDDVDNAPVLTADSALKEVFGNISSGNMMDWEMKKSMYLSGYPESIGVNGNDSLEEAQKKCKETLDCGGVTEVVKGDGSGSVFELRAGNEGKVSPSGENSWIKPM